MAKKISSPPGRSRPPGKDRRARLEELKRQQRKAERRKTATAIVGGLLVGALLIAIPVVTSIRSSAETKRKGAVGYVTTPSKDAVAAGCTGVRNDKTAGGGDHTTGRVTYDSAPPSAGRHNPDPLPDSIHFYDRSAQPSVERAVHLLEHGFVIGWYDPGLAADQVGKLKAAADGAGARFVAAPWDRGAFEAGRHFVLTAWGRSQACTTVSPQVISAFVKTYADKTAPEAGAGGGTLSSPPPAASPRPSPSKK